MKGYYKANNRSFKLKFTPKERKLSDLLLTIQSLERYQNISGDNRGLITASIRDLEYNYKQRTGNNIARGSIKNLLEELITSGDLELIYRGNGRKKATYFLPQFEKPCKIGQNFEKSWTKVRPFKDSNCNTYKETEDTKIGQNSKENWTKKQFGQNFGQNSGKSWTKDTPLKASVFNTCKETEDTKIGQNSKENWTNNWTPLYIRNIYKNNIEQIRTFNHSENDRESISSAPSKNISKESKESKSKKANTKSKYSPEFENIWKEYPRKLGKPKAFNYYKKLRENYTPEQILKATLDYKQQIQREKTEERYIKHGSSFYNNTVGGILDFIELEGESRADISNKGKTAEERQKNKTYMF